MIQMTASPFTAATQAGLCFDTASPIAAPFGIRNASTVKDCCYMCDQLASCGNFTYNQSWCAR